MAYFQPYIDASGFHIPTYPDILTEMVANMKSIYGNDIYLENDSADYQLLSIFSLKIYDAMQSAQLGYNSRSPVTAIGAALDAVVKMNGLERKAASYSTCSVTLTGTAGTTIYNGVVQDSSGSSWNLPAITIISALGTVTVSATCQVLGAIEATAGSITTISTPVSGWDSVTNSVAAVAGLPVEEDSNLRSRQSISAKLPSITLFSGTTAAVAAVSGVTRYKVYENYTNATDANGLLAHSIWAVVEGGADQDIAEAVYYNKSVGCGVNGTTEVVVVDSTYGTTNTIKFSRPTYITIYVDIHIHLLDGGNSTHIEAVRNAVTTYLNSLQIGEDLTISGIYGAAMATMPDLLVPVFSIKQLVAGTTTSPLTANDITIAFDEVTDTSDSPASVTITEV